MSQIQKVILPEEEYFANIAHIIQKDYYPDLPNIRTEYEKSMEEVHGGVNVLNNEFLNTPLPEYHMTRGLVNIFPDNEDDDDVMELVGENQHLNSFHDKFQGEDNAAFIL
jgi:hypothetical protein